MLPRTLASVRRECTCDDRSCDVPDVKISVQDGAGSVGSSQWREVTEPRRKMVCRNGGSLSNRVFFSDVVLVPKTLL